MLGNKKAFAVLEYAALCAVVAAALLISFSYMKRGVQGRLMKNADVFSDRQYEPGRTTIVGR